MKEIGSEFWSVPSGNKAYLLSGRTALEYIIRDILRTLGTLKVCLPSYCCHTMIEPFVRHGFDIRFYDVYFEDKHGLCADIPKLCKDEIFYHMSYFGFGQLQGRHLDKIREQCALIIDDRTHSFLSKSDIDADYTYTSFRKWAGFYGIAEATKSFGTFSLPIEKSGVAYTEKRREAMELKARYMAGEPVEKNEFLTLYGVAEDMLESDYVGYRPTEQAMTQLLSADFASIKQRRKQNAAVLLTGLQNVPGVRLLFPEQLQTDVPLFVPILVEGNRDALRKYLIEHLVYCPVHWPISDFHKGIGERAEKIYRKELSLLCDQRYQKEDMERIVWLIKRFVSKERI